MSRPLVLAHRGASAVEPENTLQAFRAAARLGADGVELDVHRCADGTLAIHHDSVLRDGRPLAVLLAETLPASVPTLAQVLDECSGMLVNIEIKDGCAPEVVALLQQRGGADRVLVSCFDPAVVAEVHFLDPSIPTGQLFFESDDAVSTVAAAAAAGHVAVHPWDGWVDQALVDHAHRLGLQVNTWTVDAPERIIELAALGVDAVITNRPDVARRALG
jgi:glycerophosphoryl diester phosphodiesterase